MDEDKCQQCGTPAAPDAKFCESCGANLIAESASQAPPQEASQEEPSTAPAATAGVTAPAATTAVTAPAPTAPAPTFQAPHAAASPYQGVAIRFVAILIDVIILVIITGIITAPLNAPIVTVTVSEGVWNTATAPNPLSWLAGGVSLLIWFVYFVLLEGSYGQTVGKMLVKIKVVREEDGTKIDYKDAVVRNVMRIIDFIPYFIPYLLGAILIWTSDTKQRLGDRTAHTVVVKA
ncbi:MAG: RDD family protein [Halobacteriota archaeon]